MTRIAACIALVVALVVPSAAVARVHHSVRSSVAVPQPIVTVPHKYDAGGDGGAATSGPGVPVRWFDPTLIAKTLGNDLLGQLGLPPVP